MRVLIAVLALVATPFIASVAQDREDCEKDAENSHRWQEGRHLGDKEGRHLGDKNDDKQCGSVSTSGAATISGFVFYDPNRTGVFSAGVAGIFGASVQLTGTGVSLTQPANFDGSFLIQQTLPAGTYQLCDLHSSFMIQTLPANNGCYTVTLGGTVWTVSNLYFGLTF